jgi:hypothetical protein
MRGTWIRLGLCALTIAGAALARAEEVGCCIEDCRSVAPSGGILRSLRRIETTHAECVSADPHCQRTWRAEACAPAPEVGEMHATPEPDDE